MPYTYHIDTKHEIVLFKATGAFTPEILFECLYEVISEPTFKPTYAHLVDLRDVSSFPAVSSDIQKRVDLDKKLDIQLGKCKIAIVSSDELVFGMTRMYEMLMDDATPTVRTFKNFDDTINWLGIPKEII